MAARRRLAKPSWMLCLRPSHASSLAWARSPGYDAIVTVEQLDRLNRPLGSAWSDSAGPLREHDARNPDLRKKFRSRMCRRSRYIISAAVGRSPSRSGPSPEAPVTCSCSRYARRASSHRPRSGSKPSDRREARPLASHQNAKQHIDDDNVCRSLSEAPADPPEARRLDLDTGVGSSARTSIRPLI